jgi:hypothetical protein
VRPDVGHAEERDRQEREEQDRRAGEGATKFKHALPPISNAVPLATALQLQDETVGDFLRVGRHDGFLTALSQ